MDKGAFAEDQGITYVDAATTLPNAIADTFKTMIFNAVSSVRTGSYLLIREEYAAGFHNLKLKQDKVVLIAFNLNKEVLKRESPYDTVDWEPFEIHCFRTGNKIRESSIFVLNKADLPTIHYEEISPEIIKKYALQKLKSDFFLYASSLDLNKFLHAIPQALASDRH